MRCGVSLCLLKRGSSSSDVSSGGSGSGTSSSVKRRESGIPKAPSTIAYPTNDPSQLSSVTDRGYHT